MPLLRRFGVQTIKFQPSRETPSIEGGMTLESLYDVHCASSGEFTLICRHSDEKMADCCRGFVSAWTHRLQFVLIDYWTLED